MSGLGLLFPLCVGHDRGGSAAGSCLYERGQWGVWASKVTPSCRLGFIGFRVEGLGFRVHRGLGFRVSMW